VLLISIFLSLSVYLGFHPPSFSESSAEIARGLIEKRINEVQHHFDKQFHKEFDLTHLSMVQPDSVVQQYNAFRNYQSYYRNEYEFTNGVNSVRFKKNVEPMLNIDLDALSPANNYHFNSPLVYITSFNAPQNNKIVQYVYVNTQPVSYTIIQETQLTDNEYLVKASFTNNIRYWLVSLQYPASAGMPKRHQVQIQGLLPVEEFKISKEGPNWSIVSTKFR
jgi:hypothetical protein